jgi:hypothetical protein
MTEQTCLDTFIYNGKAYELFEPKGEELITPQDYGMNPIGMWSCCWRGFESTYEINCEGLFLTNMTINGEVKEGYKSIGGIEPEIDNNDIANYKGLRLLTPFTGKLKLGRLHNKSMNGDFETSFNLEFDDFETGFKLEFIEFVFEAGKLLSIKDLGISTLDGLDYLHRNGWS